MPNPFSLGDSARCGLSDGQYALLWLIAFLTLVVGDAVTTAVGLRVGAVESNPLAAVPGRLGPVGMVGVKAAVLSLLYALYYRFDATRRFCLDDEAVLFVATLGLLVTGRNVSVVYLV
jgi:hypothetical protein